MPLQRRQDCQHVVVGRNLPLLCADRVEADDAVSVDDEHGGALAETHKFVEHVVRIEDAVVGVREQRERVVVVAHEAGDAIGVIGGDGHDLCACQVEPVDVCSQLREVPAAERSAEPSEEHQDDRACAGGVREVEAGPVLIGEGEVRGDLAEGCGAAVFSKIPISARCP
jgi:hypothetical protein